MGSRGLHAIMSSAPALHASEGIREKEIMFMKRRQGEKYMINFRRPAYFGTPIQQKDIHGYIKED